MRKLHLVGLTTDRDGLIFTARKGSKSGGYIVPLDEKLLAAIVAAGEGGNGSAPEEAVDVAAVPKRLRSESALTPREMQARLRAGRTIDEVAAEAGVDHEWVARFAVPILAEQAQVVELARSLTYAKPRLGESTEPLGGSVVQNLSDRGIFMPDDVAHAAWSAFQLHDSVWMVRFRYSSRGRDQEAQWEIDVPTGRLRARNRQASDLGYVGVDRWQGDEADDDQPNDDAAPAPRRRVAPAAKRPAARAARPARAAAPVRSASRTAAPARGAATSAAPARRPAKSAAPARGAAQSAAPARRPAKSAAPARGAAKSSRAPRPAAPARRPAKSAAPARGAATSAAPARGAAKPARGAAKSAAPARGAAKSAAPARGAGKAAAPARGMAKAAAPAARRGARAAAAAAPARGTASASPARRASKAPAPSGAPTSASAARPGSSARARSAAKAPQPARGPAAPAPPAPLKNATMPQNVAAAREVVARRGAATGNPPRPAAPARATARRRPTKAVPAPEAGPAAGSGGVRMAVAQVSAARVAASMAAADRSPWAAAVRRPAAGAGVGPLGGAHTGHRSVVMPQELVGGGGPRPEAPPAASPFQPRPLPRPGTEPPPTRVRRIGGRGGAAGLVDDHAGAASTGAPPSRVRRIGTAPHFDGLAAGAGTEPPPRARRGAAPRRPATAGTPTGQSGPVPATAPATAAASTGAATARRAANLQAPPLPAFDAGAVPGAERPKRRRLRSR